MGRGLPQSTQPYGPPQTNFQSKPVPNYGKPYNNSSDDNTEDDGLNKPRRKKPKSKHKKDATRAIAVMLERIKKYRAQNHLRVIIRLLIGDFIAIDDFGDKCSFSTKTHNPFFAKTNVTRTMANLQEGEDVVFDKEIKFAK